MNVRVRDRAVLAAALICSLASMQFGRNQPAEPAQAAGRVSACPSQSSAGNPSVPPSYVTITFVNECGENVPLAVDVASTEAEQESGLMNITNLPPDQGELFAFQNLGRGGEVVIGFWMKDTPIPLSIAFIGADSEVHEIQDMQAETTNVHLPRAPYLYAVEANLNWFAQHSIIPGSSVDLSAATAQMSSTGAQPQATTSP